MSIETTLKSVLNPLLTGGCHNVVNTATTVVHPYAVFYEVSGIPENTIHGYGGITQHRYQIDVFAKSPEQAKGLALGTMKSDIETSAILQGQLIFHMVGEYSEADRTYQYITEYYIWSV